jgi:NAD(P)-dependent dehydrogenase (short-subunit alcohol dehydrogenase family)
MAEDVFGLQGKSVLVVGGGQGIGEAVCLAFARAGSAVAVLDVDRDRAQGVTDKIIAMSGKARALSGDVLDDAQVAAMMDEAEKAFFGLDVLVTVVGSTGFLPILETTAVQWDLEHRVNVRYAFLVGKAFAAERVRTGKPGAATFVSSISGIVSAPRHAPYGAAKAGLIHLVKTMAVEWAPHGIRVNSVAPGPIITPRLPDTEEWREQIRRSTHPMQRRGTVDEIANAVLYLSSSLASYVTGQTLAVDGGLTAANILAVPATMKPR